MRFERDRSRYVVRRLGAYLSLRRGQVPRDSFVSRNVEGFTFDRKPDIGGSSESKFVLRETHTSALIYVHPCQHIHLQTHMHTIVQTFHPNMLLSVFACPPGSSRRPAQVQQFLPGHQHQQRQAPRSTQLLHQGDSKALKVSTHIGEI